jgi:hypothetical protein
MPTALIIALGVAAVIALTIGAPAQQAKDNAASDFGYPSVAAALEGMRVKSGTRSSVQDGWTVVEDSATKSIWSFAPQGHPAHPAVVRRTVVQEGNNISIQMSILCEAAKAACDKLAADFAELNNQMRRNLNRPKN